MVRIGNVGVSFDKGEHIRTEYSHKYRLEHFGRLAGQAGFEVEKCLDGRPASFQRPVSNPRFSII